MELEDEILNNIDRGTIRPRNHVVTRSIAGEIREANPFYAEALSRFDAGTAVGDEALLEQIWRLVDQSPPRVEGRFRLLLGLAQPDEAIDWELGGWIIYWGREAGLTDDAIRRAFGVGDLRGT
jgi:hypothetical protein